jgi:TonB family protein
MISLLFAVAVATQAPITAPSPVVDAIHAKANRAAISVEAVQVKSGHLSDELRAQLIDAKARGHHGFATIGGVVQTDGSLTDIALVEPTGSPILDQAAIELVRGAVFQPAKNKLGEPLAAWKEVELQFTGRFRKSGSTGGLTTYRCDQFVNDMDWWKAAVPNRPWRRNPLYSELLALNFGATMFKPKSAVTDAQVEADWNRTLLHCRTNPDQLLVEGWQGTNNLVRSLMALVG